MLAQFPSVSKAPLHNQPYHQSCFFLCVKTCKHSQYNLLHLLEIWDTAGWFSSCSSYEGKKKKTNKLTHYRTGAVQEFTANVL